MGIIDNIHKTLKDDMFVTLRSCSKVAIAASYFSIYALQELKEQLGEIDELRFIFTSPSFVTEKVDKQCRESYIPQLNRERDLDDEIKLRKSESKKTSRFEEKGRFQRLIKDLEKRRSEKRLNLYQAQDEVDARKETLLAKVETMLAQKIEQSKLITFHWRII